MTLEEQERRAYADGDVERAALLRDLIDALALAKTLEQELSDD